MSEHDQKERVLTGETVEAQDKVELAAVRANLVQLARIKKGLPLEPVSLDVEAISELSNSTLIDEPAEAAVPKVIPVDISKLSTNHSVVGLVTHQERLKKIGKKAA